MLSVRPNQLLLVSVTMLNTGFTTWSNAGNYKLGLYSTEYITQVVLSGAGDSSVNGTYSLPINDDTFEGLRGDNGKNIYYNFTNKIWTVGDATRNNKYYTNDLKTSNWQSNVPSPNPPPNAVVTLNTYDPSIWGTTRVSLPSPVPPNVYVTFNFSVIAPTTGGIFDFQWRMLQEPNNWFGISCSDQILIPTSIT
jgi:hypothetical protein